MLYFRCLLSPFYFSMAHEYNIRFSSLHLNFLLETASFKIFSYLYYSECGNEIKLFKNYLCERKQYLPWNGFKSSSLDVSYEIPQGSILGHLIFFILPSCDFERVGLELEKWPRDDVRYYVVYYRALSIKVH